jgi:hypothetical protein
MDEPKTTGGETTSEQAAVVDELKAEFGAARVLSLGGTDAVLAAGWQGDDADHARGAWWLVSASGDRTAATGEQIARAQHEEVERADARAQAAATLGRPDAMVEHAAGPDCGWWPPGRGEPGQDWDFEPAPLALSYDADDMVVHVHVATPKGPRVLAAVPVEAIARVLAEGVIGRTERKGGDGPVGVAQPQAGET